MDINNETLGRRIKSIRTGMGLTTKEFGRLVDGASDSLVSRWERGVNKPNNKRLKRIAELGNVSIEELLYGDIKTFLKKLVSLELEELSNSFPDISDKKYNLPEIASNTYLLNNKNVSYSNVDREKLKEYILALYFDEFSKNERNMPNAIEALIDGIVQLKDEVLKEYFIENPEIFHFEFWSENPEKEEEPIKFYENMDPEVFYELDNKLNQFLKYLENKIDDIK